MSENHFFAEQILCNDRMDDKTVERRQKQSQPKAWARGHTRHEETVVERRGVFARVRVEQPLDTLEPFLAGGAELLEGLSPDERAALLSGAVSGAISGAISGAGEASGAANAGSVQANSSQAAASESGSLPPPPAPASGAANIFASSRAAALHAGTRRRRGAVGSRGSVGLRGSIGAWRPRPEEALPEAAPTEPLRKKARAGGVDCARLSFQEDDG